MESADAEECETDKLSSERTVLGTHGQREQSSGVLSRRSISIRCPNDLCPLYAANSVSRGLPLLCSYC